MFKLKKWSKRYITLVISLLFLLLALSLFSGAIIISRVNTVIITSDALLEKRENKNWFALWQNKINHWLINWMGDENELNLRLYAANVSENTQKANVYLQKLSQSDNPKIASLALTWIGNIYVFQGLANQDEKLLELAIQIFTKAVVLDPNNEYAKHNLELLISLPSKEGGNEDKNDNSSGNDEDENQPPSQKGGEEGEYSEY